MEMVPRLSCTEGTGKVLAVDDLKILSGSDAC